MTAAAAALRHRSWRIWRVAPLNEAAFRVRLFLAPGMLAIQIFLYYCLWSAVFRHTVSTAGLDVHQTITYATLGILIAHIRWSSRLWSRDAIEARVREGTIVYWFLRPISPARYYMVRGLGDMGYGGLWALLGYVLALATGMVQPPGSPAVAVVAAASLLLGQVILYYLGQIVDLLTFWLVSSTGLTRMYYFIQDLLSGVFVPLWFMPGWLLTAAAVLPFAYAVNVPLSLYVGRIPLDQAAGELLLQLVWIAALALLARFLWSRAGRRVTVQGG